MAAPKKLSATTSSLALRAYKKELEALKQIRHDGYLRKQLGEKIRALREECGLTAPELAYLLDTGDSAIGSFEAGLKAPKLETLQKIQILRKAANIVKGKLAEVAAMEEV